MLQANKGEFWVKKIERTIERDREVDQKLLFLGWIVIHFWGKEIVKNTDECVRVIEEAIFEDTVRASVLDEVEETIE